MMNKHCLYVLLLCCALSSSSSKIAAQDCPSYEIAQTHSLFFFPKSNSYKSITAFWTSDNNWIRPWVYLGIAFLLISEGIFIYNRLGMMYQENNDKEKKSPNADSTTEENGSWDNAAARPSLLINFDALKQPIFNAPFLSYTKHLEAMAFSLHMPEIKA